MTSSNAFEQAFGFARKDVTLGNWREQPFNRWAFQNVGEMVRSARIPAGEGKVESAPVELGGLLAETVAINGRNETVVGFLERDIFDDTLSFASAHLTIFWRSLKLAIMATVATLIFGFPTAYFIATRPERTRDIWLFLITIPFWTNLLIRTFAVLQVIRNEGLINTALINLGIVDQPIQMLYTDFAIMVGMVYVYLPLMVLPLYASMEKLDFRLVEAGYDLYATRWQVLKRIIFPLVRPGVVAGSILVFIPAIGAYVTPSVLGGGKNMMFANLIELQFGQGRNWPLGAALSITVMAIVMVALLVYVRNTSGSEVRHG